MQSIMIIDALPTRLLVDKTASQKYCQRNGGVVFGFCDHASAMRPGEGAHEIKASKCVPSATASQSTKMEYYQVSVNCLVNSCTKVT